MGHLEDLESAGPGTKLVVSWLSVTPVTAGVLRGQESRFQPLVTL
jgi:hypothetical protein